MFVKGNLVQRIFFVCFTLYHCNSQAVLILCSFINTKILGGQTAVEENFPYLVSLQYEEDHKCGGCIVSSTTVLTAAHCVLYFPDDRLSVLAGTNVLNKNGVRYYVKKTIPHEKFDPENYLSDIAIVVLNTSIEYTDLVSSIPLGCQKVPSGSEVIFSGWGSNILNGEPQTTLQTVVLKLISYQKCREMDPDVLTQSNLEIYTFTKKGQGVCQGDSGGPLVAYDSIIGIASRGRPCGIGFPEIYTRVCYYSNWIKFYAPNVKVVENPPPS